ncbi:hypothetical protein EDB89DRAFT_177915 [Lactarius sanguifluus]|nr:hypothetical protein EDB89DRAFT_177915 [Lactarius sanguifluus]
MTRDRGPRHGTERALPFLPSPVPKNLLIDVQLDPVRPVRAGNQRLWEVLIFCLIKCPFRGSVRLRPIFTRPAFGPSCVLNFDNECYTTNSISTVPIAFKLKPGPWGCSKDACGIYQGLLTIHRILLPWQGTFGLHCHSHRDSGAATTCRPGRLRGELNDCRHCARTVPRPLGLQFCNDVNKFADGTGSGVYAVPERVLWAVAEVFCEHPRPRELQEQL